MAWDEPPPATGAGWDEPPPGHMAGPPSDLDLVKGSFADPTARAKGPQPAFRQHPLDWAAAHAGDVLPTLGMMAGGTLGGTAAGALGLPSGPGALAAGYGGAVAGAGAGQAGGEALRAAIGRLIGNNQEDIPSEALKEAKQGALGEAIGKPVTGALGMIGKNLYNSALRPVIKQMPGAEEALYRGGVMTPKNLPEKADAIKSALGNDVVQPILQEAENAGAKVDTDKLTGPLRKLQAKEANTRTPESDQAAQAAKARADYYDQKVQGTPAVPASTVVKTSPILDAQGNPFQSAEEIPGSPAIPGELYGPAEAARVKTRVGSSTPKNQLTGIDEQIQNANYRGALQAGEDAVSRTLSPEKAQAIKNANADMGKLIGSETGQKTAADQYDRAVTGLTSFNPGDIYAGALGSGIGAYYGSPYLGLLAGALGKKGFEAARLGQMPAGYALKKFADSPVVHNAAISGATSAWNNMNPGEKQPVAGVGR